MVGREILKLTDPNFKLRKNISIVYVNVNFIANNFDDHTHIYLYKYMHTSTHRDIKDICKDISSLPDMF